MSTLLKIIRTHSKDAAKALEDADIRSDKDIKTLTREELNELLPGKDNFRLRREVFEIIRKTNPTIEVLREMKEFIPDESFRAALSNNGVLVDYFHILKEMKSQVDQVQKFCDDHINFLEEFRKDTPPHSESGRGSHVPANTGAFGDQTYGDSQGAQDSSGGDVQMGSPSGSSGNDSDGKNSYVHLPREIFPVPYKAVVCGTTFGADQQVLQKVKANVQLSETNSDHKCTLLFCVISSRVGSDVDAALAEVKDDKPIILVLMHHSHTPSVTTSLRTWAHDGNDTNVVMHVDIFFHEKFKGLLTCRENDNAILEVQRKLLRYYPGARVEPNGQGFLSKVSNDKRGKNTKKQ